MTKHLACLIATLSLGSAVHAQDWQRIGPDGGTVHALEAPEPAGNRAYAVSAGGLFRSDDRGATWQLLPAPDASTAGATFIDAGFSRANPDAIVLARGNDVWRSTDAGQTWQQLSFQLRPTDSLQRITAIAVDPDDARRIAIFVVIVANDINVTLSARWYTEDGGLTGDLASTPENNSIPCLRIVRNAYDHVNAAIFHQGKLYYSHFHTCLGMDALPRPHIRQWGNPLDHWFTPYSPQSWNYTVPGALAVLGDKAFFSHNGSPLVRVDLQDGSRSEVLDRAETAQVAGDGSLVAGSRSGLYRSLDLGATWQRMDDGQSDVPDVAMQSGPVAFFTSPTRWLAGGINGISAASAADGPWQPASRGLTSWPARAVAIDPGNEQRIWAASLTSSRLLMRTSDGGHSWQRGDLDGFNPPLHSVIVDPATTSSSGGTVVYATGGGCLLNQSCPLDAPDAAAILRSRDSGATWEMIAGDLPNLRYRSLRRMALVRLPGMQQPRLLVTGSQPIVGYVLRSDDGGSSWVVSDTGLPADSGQPIARSDVLDIQAVPGDPRRVYLATVAMTAIDHPAAPASGVFRSDDGGVTWTHRSNGLPMRPDARTHDGVLRVAVHPTNPDAVWAISYIRDEHGFTEGYKVQVSRNGGQSWQERSSGLGSGQMLAIAVDPDQPTHIYVGGVDGVFHSSDDGQSWQRLGTIDVGSVTGLAIGPRHLFAATPGGVQKILKPGQSAGPEPCPESPPGTIRRHLDPHCSGRLWMPPR